MDMLDATLAFALTLAALATIVTIVLEAIHRLLRVRKWNLILTLKKLSGEIANDKLFTGKCCWDFVVSVLNNGTRPDQQKLLKSDQMLKTQSASTSSGSGLISFFRDRVFTFSFGNMLKPDKSNDQSWLKSIESLQRNQATRGVFDKVSVEHVLRRFAELDEVKEKIAKSRDLVEAQLDKIARKYEEFASSVTADFKRRSKMWSITIGIIIALTANVNAVRIFESYIKDQNLSSRVIGQFEQFEQQAQDAQTKLDDALADTKSTAEDKFSEQISVKNKNIESLIAERGKLSGQKLKDKNDEIKQEQLALQKLIKQDYAESEAGKAQQAMNDAGENLRSLSELGVPIGINYFPHCMVFKPTQGVFNAENLCAPVQAKSKLILPLFIWIIMTGLTGVLIGMGAPFWFDVARRIAEVRSMFNGKEDNEKRLSGKDVNGDQQERKKLITNVLDDAVNDQKLAVVNPTSP